MVYCTSPEQATEGANALLILTEWEEFARLDLGKLKKTMANPIIVDGRNVLDRDAVTRLGFEYYSVGRK
jgi:UDPglucose 6-dehydrogenase